MLTSTNGSSNILPPQYGALITDPLTENALAFDSRVTTTIRTGAERFRAPRLVEDVAAAWVAEGEEIAPSDPTLDEIEIVPKKLGGLTIISRELAEDSNPSAQAIVGQSLARALTTQVDTGFFGAGAEAAAAKGLGSITPTVHTGQLTSLDLLHEAKALAADNGGKPTALLAHPSDVLTLAKLKEGTGSNQALLQSTDSAAGVPVISTRHANPGTLWMVDASQILTVLREDTTLAVSRDAYFTSDRIAVRATVRIAWGFLTPAALVRIHLTTGA
ncbi:phage major capsid protein [Brachybacterium sp. GCM10030252]|uniref:phage major capsid protein n=1 Tax=Brachybacterium sp. GCM10030252 TaxID=3273380 RepID=UPI00360F1072